MSPSGKKNKGKRNSPRPNYRRQAREQAKEQARHTWQIPTTSAAPVTEPMYRGPSSVVGLDPLSPIIVRSGRPLEGRSDADPARFPPPSTLAGCLRTAWARATGRPFGPELAKMTVAGPLLLTRAGQVLAPKPADALYFGHGGSERCLRARPCTFDAACGADLPDDLLPVQLTEQTEEKPGGGPAWWLWDDLLAFRNDEDVTYRRLCENGWTPPSGDRRTHVVIDPGTGASSLGGLFETEGLDLDIPKRSCEFAAGELQLAVRAGSFANGLAAASASAAGGLRLLARCGLALSGTLVHLGGKRRMAVLEPEPEHTWPAPPGWLDRICDAGGLCLTLLTPAVFSAGYRPGWLDGDLTGSPPFAPGLRLRLRAAAVDRWQPHSGWDLARGRPRPSRKLAGAGATYWFRILGGADPDAVKALWLTSVSDLEQDRRDGFGIALPSPWTSSADAASRSAS